MTLKISTLHRRSSVACASVLSTFILAFVSLIAAPRAAIGNLSLQQSIIVDDPRPLAAAVLQLEHRHGWVITYEDPRFDYSLDADDVTFSVARVPVPPEKKILIPRGGRFTFTYETLDARTTVQALIAAFALTGHPGTFRLTEVGGVFHVLPDTARDHAGRIVPQRSLLDTRISLPIRDRNGWEWLDDVRNAVKEVTGTKCGIMSMPINVMMLSRSRGGAVDEPARDVLVRALAATGRKLSWRLLYDPELKTYGLNVHLLKD